MTVTVALDPEDVFAGGVFEGDFSAHNSRGRKWSSNNDLAVYEGSEHEVIQERGLVLIGRLAVAVPIREIGEAWVLVGVVV